MTLEACSRSFKSAQEKHLLYAPSCHEHLAHSYTCRDGTQEGAQEGRELGLQKGFEVAQELGFYRGCLQVLMHVETLAVIMANAHP